MIWHHLLRVMHFQRPVNAQVETLTYWPASLGDAARGPWVFVSRRLLWREIFMAGRRYGLR
jgi:hypothetical protein